VRKLGKGNSTKHKMKFDEQSPHVQAFIYTTKLPGDDKV
jgi:hypothetical protein